jgi:hypothetical protein
MGMGISPSSREQEQQQFQLLTSREFQSLPQDDPRKSLDFLPLAVKNRMTVETVNGRTIHTLTSWVPVPNDTEYDGFFAKKEKKKDGKVRTDISPPIGILKRYF